MFGVVYVDEPESNNVPPVAAEYQSIVTPVAAVADKVAVDALHIDTFDAIGAAGALFTRTVYVAVAATHGLEDTVIVNVIVLPVSAKTEV